MQCLTDIEIELLVLQEGESQKDLSRQAGHIKTCLFCSGRIKDARMFYNDVADFVEKPLSQREKALVKELEITARQNIHIAYPFFMQTRPQIDPVSVMAAANMLAPTPGIVDNMGVLATKGKDILIRIMKSAANGEVDLHLISENEQKYRNVLVRLPFLQDEFTSDENGKVHLGDVELPELEDITVEVQTPRAAFDLSAINFENEQIESQAEVVLTNEDNDSIKCEFIAAEPDYTLKVHLIKFMDAEENKLRVMVSRSKQAPNLVQAQKGIAIFQGLEPRGNIRIQVFD